MEKINLEELKSQIDLLKKIIAENKKQIEAGDLVSNRQIFIESLKSELEKLEKRYRFFQALLHRPVLRKGEHE